jgi:hypothetical protein
MADNIFKFGPGEIVQRPYSLDPWSSQKWRSNATWLKLKARKIVDQLSSGRGGQIAGGEDGATFLFLGPRTISENIGHSWEAYDSIQSRIAEKVASAAKTGRDVVSLVEGGKGFNTSQITNLFSNTGSNYGVALENVVRAAYNSVAGHSVPKIKIDKPLVYSTSNRRQITFELELIAEKDPKKDIVDVIQDLMKYSCAGISQRSNIDIEFPYFFEVTTEPSQVIKYSTCALTAVQPSYGEPWRNGYPMSAKLQLTFEDISPLFRQTIQSGSLINVISGNTVNRKDPSATLSSLDKQSSINAIKTRQDNAGKPESVKTSSTDADF